MTTALNEQTVLPPEDQRDALAELARALASVGETHQSARLVGPDGTEVVVPEVVGQVLRSVVTAMAHGFAITVAPHGTMLTTQEAADRLSISRPTLVRLLVDGEIPFEQRGRHRRVQLADILAYQQRMRSEREAALDEMAATGAEDGIYTATADPIRTR